MYVKHYRDIILNMSKSMTCIYCRKTGWGKWRNNSQYQSDQTQQVAALATFLLERKYNLLLQDKTIRPKFLSQETVSERVDLRWMNPITVSNSRSRWIVSDHFRESHRCSKTVDNIKWPLFLRRETRHFIEETICST